MFGVLVVKNSDGQLGYIAGVEGNEAIPEFVPPIFDTEKRQHIIKEGDEALDKLSQGIALFIEKSGIEGRKQKLQAVMAQRDEALRSLKQEHKIRKSQRQSQRDTLPKSDDNDIQAKLVALSFESQRDKLEMRDQRKHWNERINLQQTQLDERLAQLHTMQREYKQCASRIRKQVFATSVLINRLGEHQPIAQFYEHNHPPEGAGECAGAKLIHYAIKHKLTPLALTEFWWGAAPEKAIRHHGFYYPSCRGKCRPILPFMLKGIEVAENKGLHYSFGPHEPVTVYEDEDLVVVNKPSGMLSVPGKEITDSVLTRLQQRYPKATGPLLVHRLDMSTSGLLLAAKSADAHKKLQLQFEQRKVEKRYEAILSAQLPEGIEEGIIKLPLRVDIEDRPRQVVCFEYGRPAITRWEIIKRNKVSTRVYFYPITGRTHQLRLHAAHPRGLNTPIVGDELYHVAAQRLLLHAQRLCFTHPRSGKRIELTVDTPF